MKMIFRSKTEDRRHWVAVAVGVLIMVVVCFVTVITSRSREVWIKNSESAHPASLNASGTGETIRTAGVNASPKITSSKIVEGGTGGLVLGAATGSFFVPSASATSLRSVSTSLGGKSLVSSGSSSVGVLIPAGAAWKSSGGTQAVVSAPAGGSLFAAQSSTTTLSASSSDSGISGSGSDGDEEICDGDGS